jgi:predicted transcriptional regulator/DNA-binding XRE family transcriptional regulator
MQGSMGARIRARRGDLGLRQAQLAEAVGISAPYLNLIEHDRRPIGGKLLVSLARALGVEPSTLAEGAEAGLLATLVQAGHGIAPEERARAGEFAARLPGWAGLVAAQDRRIRDLEARVEALGDRLAHDPRLAGALHEVLSVVTAIRATASILSDTGDLDRTWLQRFHRNLAEDSLRLSDSAQALVGYLEGEATGTVAARSPREVFEAWLVARAAGEGAGLPGTPEADALAEAWLAQAAEDAAAMPAEAVAALLADDEDPAVVAAAFGVSLPGAFRRIAALPGLPRAPYGLVMADAAGAVTLRLPPPGFQMPRLGAACALWPLFLALSRPLQPLRLVIEQAARQPSRFVTWAVSVPAGPASFTAPAPVVATMLIRRATPDETAPALPVGTTCGVCPRDGCPARREPSVLG